MLSDYNALIEGYRALQKEEGLVGDLLVQEEGILIRMRSDDFSRTHLVTWYDIGMYWHNPIVTHIGIIAAELKRKQRENPIN